MAHVLDRMDLCLQAWSAAADDKALFLDCYRRMTGNMLTAVEQQVFEDAAWVRRLLGHFATYYFEALDAYERDPGETPAVWRCAHDLACRATPSTLQKVLLGVNAHINYDLVLTLVDLLQPEWPHLTPEGRARRYADHCRVNDIIGATIDEVQDHVIEPTMPLMEWVDRLMGPVDERMISMLITHWRERVWQHATGLLELSPHEQEVYLQHVEADVMKTAVLICREADA